MFYRFLMLISLIIVAQSCQKTEPAPIEVVTIDQEFDLSVSQIINESGNSFVLTIKSVEYSDCENVDLDASISQIDNDITIQINGNVLNGDCIPGGIQSEKQLTLPKSPGEYNIEIKQGELSSTTGLLSISVSDFNLDIDNIGGIFYEGQSLKVIPEFLAWGYYADQLPDASTQIFLEEMITELGFRQTVFEDLEDGDYSRFRIENGEIIIDDIDLQHITFAYRFEDEVAWEKLLNQFANFETNFPRLKYRIERWDGKSASN